MTLPRVATLALLACGGALPAHAQSIEDALRRLIAEHAEASHRRDLEGLVRLYHADAEMVSSTGTRTVGRAAIETAYRASVEGPGGRTGRHHVHPPESIRIQVLGEATAVVEVESHSRGGRRADGTSLPDSRSLLVTVWSRRNGVWAVDYQRAVPIPET